MAKKPGKSNAKRAGNAGKAKAPAKVPVKAKAPAPKLTGAEIYARRKAKGLAEGKTLQQARGHVVREHVRRKERELARKAGTGAMTSAEKATVNREADRVAKLTKNQRGIIRRFATEQQRRSHALDDEDEAKEFRRSMMHYAEVEGFAAFTQVRATQRLLEANYRRELAAGTYEMRPHLLDMYAVADNAPDTRFYFYH